MIPLFTKSCTTPDHLKLSPPPRSHCCLLYSYPPSKTKDYCTARLVLPNDCFSVLFQFVPMASLVRRSVLPHYHVYAPFAFRERMFLSAVLESVQICFLGLFCFCFALDFATLRHPCTTSSASSFQRSRNHTQGLMVHLQARTFFIRSHITYHVLRAFMVTFLILLFLIDSGKIGSHDQIRSCN